MHTHMTQLNRKDDCNKNINIMSYLNNILVFRNEDIMEYSSIICLKHVFYARHQLEIELGGIDKLIFIFN